MATLSWAATAAAAAAIAGKVTNSSAQPLAGIEVCALDPNTFGEECAQTDSEDEYSIPGSGPGEKVHFYARENKAPSLAPQWYPASPIRKKRPRSPKERSPAGSTRPWPKAAKSAA
jgi:hypothetical protein